MKCTFLLAISLFFLISCNKEEEPIFPDGSNRLPGRYYGTIYYTGSSGSQTDYNFNAIVKFVDKNFYTIGFEDLDLPVIEIEVSSEAADLLIKYNVISDGWQSSGGYQCNYFHVFDMSRGSAKDGVVLCLSAIGGTVAFKFNGTKGP